MNDNLIFIFSSIIIIAVVLICLIIEFRKKPSKHDKESINAFLSNLETDFYNEISRIISNIDFSKYDTIAEMEADVLKQFYDSLTIIAQIQLKELAENSILSTIAYKLLDEELIDKFLDDLLSTERVNSQLEAAWEKNFFKESNIDKIVEEDNKLQEEFSDQEKYVEDLNTDDLKEFTGEDFDYDDENLIPQTEDEKEYNLDDISVEPVNDDIYIDARGRKHSKTTGRYV